MADTFQQQEVKTKYPVVEGLTSGTTKQTQKRFLRAEKKSLIPERKMIGIW